MAYGKTSAERRNILADLSAEGRIAFVAFCAERCVKEARRRQAPSEDLNRRPEIAEALAILWSAAEGGDPPDPGRAAELREHFLAYERREKADTVVVYRHDVTLVQAAGVFLLGLRLLREPATATPRLVATAVDGPGILVATIYEDAVKARTAENGVLDQALDLLQAAAPPLSRTMFDGIPDWPRGTLVKRYAEGKLTDSREDEEFYEEEGE